MRSPVLPFLALLVLFSACTTADPAGPADATPELETGSDAPSADLFFPEVGELPGADTPPDIPLGDIEVPPLCEPGDGCFGDPCDQGSDCLSGWCVEHLGDGVCTQTCEEECPAGWTCQQVAGTAPDVVFVCVSDFANLCKPCAGATGCVDPTGAEDVCVDYGSEGSFCGGFCDEEQACPAGYECQEVQTTDSVPTSQCVAIAGVCACSDKAVALALWTPCAVTNTYGTCEGMRACTAEGLTDCDAATPMAEACNGEDDDCDGLVDEEICDDGNPCTDDTCVPGVGCEHLALDGIPCAGTDPCAGEWLCESGACVGEAKDCDDGKICTVDSCDPADGHCDHAPVDGNCPSSNNPCISQVFCDPFAGPEADPDQDGCVVVMKTPGTGCNDDDACTTGETCQARLGTLLCIGEPVDFDDANPCTADSCDPDLGPQHEWISGCEVPCAPGEMTSADCGLCGTHSKTCPESGKWSDAAWSDCLGQGVCTPNVTETENCGNCGTQSRQCLNTCLWSAWGECQAEGPCTPGEILWEACEGLCTSKAAICTDECQWGPWGACEQQGECTPEALDVKACGDCGTQTRICTDLCTWGLWGVCQGEGTCSPGAIESLLCGQCGAQERICTDQCQWGSWGACSGEGVCSEGQTQTQDCGNCGSQTRSCTAECQWTAWSMCLGQGVCSPFDTASQDCGNCGTQTRQCSSQCLWGSWGVCGGEGVCSPGQPQTQACGNCGTQTRSCTGNCYWGSWSSCNDPCACECSDGTCCSNGCDYDSYGTSCAACKKCNSSGSCSVDKPDGTSCSGGVCYNGTCGDCLPGDLEYCDPNCGAFDGSTDGYHECQGGTWGICKPVVCEPNGTTYYQAVPDDYFWHCKNSSVYPGELYLCLKTYTFWICGVSVIEFRLQKATGLSGNNAGPFDNNLSVVLRNVDKNKTKSISQVNCEGSETCYFTVGVNELISQLSLTGTDSFEVEVTSPIVGGIYVGTTGKAKLEKCY